MKRVLVTGAGGFLGCHVVHRLLKSGVEVGALVRPGSAAARLRDVKGHTHLSFLEGDLAFPGSAAAALERFRPEAVVHLASAGVWGHATLAEMIRVNVAGLAHLLERPDLLGRRLVVAGSMFEYGDHEGEIDEEAECRPAGAYGFTKLKAAELLLRRDDVDWVLLRFFGLYGPWEPPGRLVPDLMAGLREGRPIDLSDGRQVRDVVYVRDAAGAVVAALEAAGAAQKVINIGSGRGVSVREVAQAAVDVAGREEERPARQALLRFGALPRRPGEPERIVARAERARNLLGWEATTTLEEGLRQTFAWFRKRRGGAAARTEAPAVGFSIVMPCYNEEESLRQSIPPLADILARQGLSAEIVLVDNGSADGTGKAIDGLARAGLPVRRVDVAVNEGYGAGILAGLEAARGRLAGFMCADGQVAPEDVARVLWAARRAGPGTLVKVRRISRGDGLFRWFQSRLFNLLCLVLFRTLSTDVNGTPKVMERTEWERMGLKSRDWFIDAETMIKAKRLGLNLVEVPVRFLPRQSGRSWVNLSTTLEFLGNLWRTVRRGL